MVSSGSWHGYKLSVASMCGLDLRPENFPRRAIIRLLQPRLLRPRIGKVIVNAATGQPVAPNSIYRFVELDSV